ncbi:unnamed protein product [Pedinophyceae sp. YPF-701]|nr:unnamed protein product [Pedinophyceae sp. YPF-701]
MSVLRGFSRVAGGSQGALGAGWARLASAEGGLARSAALGGAPAQCSPFHASSVPKGLGPIALRPKSALRCAPGPTPRSCPARPGGLRSVFDFAAVRRRVMGPFSQRAGAQASEGGAGPTSVLSLPGSLKRVTRGPSLAAERAREAGNAALDRVPWLRRFVKDPGSLRKAVGLHAEAIWQAHRGKIVAGGAVVSAIVLWRTMYAIATNFLSLSETVAEGGFLALAAAMVAFALMYARSLYTIRPDSVYRMAMVRLNSSPGALEVLGAPLSGSDIRAYVVTGGGLKVSGWRPKLRARRVQMIFPVRGSERRGLVTLEAKRRHGRYQMKLLAVDVPAAAGGDQRLYLEGGEAVFQRGGVLSELRDPFLRALAMKETYDREDEQEDEEEGEEQARQQRSESMARAAATPAAQEGSAGVQTWEWAAIAAQRKLQQARDAIERAGRGQAG